MSISYPNLPGIEVSAQDGGLILPEDGTTESLLIIAPSTATEVPADPTLARQSSDAVTYFGAFTDKNGVVNPITAAWKAAFEGGNRRTYLLAVNGEGADAAAKTKSAFLKMHNLFFGILADFTIDNIALRDYFADKETTVLTAADFTNPEDVANFPNVGGVLKYGFKVASTALSYPVTIATGTSDSFVLNIGTDKTVTIGPKVYDGTSGKTFADLAADIKEDLTAAAGLENFNVLIEENKLVILGDTAFTYKVGTAGDATAALKMTADAVAVKTRHDEGTLYVGNFAELLKDYCEDQTINHNTVKGFIGVSAPLSTTLTDIKTAVDAAVALNNEYSGHLSVTAGPELAYSVPGKSGYYYANGAVTYAALVSTLPAQSAPTNKAVSGVAGLAYNLSLRQLNSLSGNKYVSFRFKNGGVYVTDGITTAPDIVIGNQTNKSDYTRLSTLRITHAAINMIRQVSEPFIGEPSGVPQRNALNSALNSGFIGMRSAGAVSDYAFTVTQAGSQIGQTKITVQLVPAFENTKISVDVSLRPLLS
jgi:hypothetical protein